MSKLKIINNFNFEIINKSNKLFIIAHYCSLLLIIAQFKLWREIKLYFKNIIFFQV